jgi:hypothetical protein
MPGAVAARALCFVAIATSAARAQPDKPKLRPVAVIALTEDDGAAKKLRQEIEDALYNHWALKPPANRFDKELEGKFLDEDASGIALARQQVKTADDKIAQGDLDTARNAARTGLLRLADVTPTVANALRADLAFSIGMAELNARDKKAAAAAFAFASRLDPARRLDPSSYLDQIVRAFETARTAPAPNVQLEVTGAGRVWIDGVAVGAAGTFEVAVGTHLVQIADFDHETRGAIVDAPGKLAIDAPIATAELKVQRARAALARAPDQTAIAGSLRQLADVVGVRDAVLITKKEDRLLVQTVTWSGALPVFSVERDPVGVKPEELLEPLSGPKPIDVVKEPPRPPIKPRIDPLITEGQPAWYRKRWVQLSIAGGVVATVAAIVLFAHRDQTVPLDTKTRFPLP